jgi:NAD(P)-dependent dehydrogenase (short-subunit alcohol dehydrogenase family)
LEQLRDERLADGVQVDIVDADLTVPADLDRLFEACMQRPLAAAVLNAGVTYFGRFEALDAASVAATIATNVTSVVELTRRRARVFGARSDRGKCARIDVGFEPRELSADAVPSALCRHQIIGHQFRPCAPTRIRGPAALDHDLLPGGALRPT